jgi:hypothetical protein|nr:MAG TPA: hypothetical protein [Caudoviricetes sp.]
MKKDYNYYKNKGICVSCKSEKVENYVRCKSCRDKKNEYYKLVTKRRYNKGLCVRCGKPKEHSEFEDLKHCIQCLKNFRDYSKHYYNKHKDKINEKRRIKNE